MFSLAQRSFLRLRDGGWRVGSGLIDDRGVGMSRAGPDLDRLKQNVMAG